MTTATLQHASIRAHFRAEARRPATAASAARDLLSHLERQQSAPTAQDLAAARVLLARIEASIETGALAAAALAAERGLDPSQKTIRELGAAEKTAARLRCALGRF